MKTKDKPKGPLKRVELEIDERVAECLRVMEEHTKIPSATLIDQALKRFISAHSDYFPEGYKRPV